MANSRANIYPVQLQGGFRLGAEKNRPFYRAELERVLLNGFLDSFYYNISFHICK